MTLKICAPLCGLLLAILFFSIRSGQRFEKVERAYLASGEADFSPETLAQPSAFTVGQMFKISSGNRTAPDKIRNLAEEFAAKRHKDAQWVEGFMKGYESPGNVETNASAGISFSH